MRVGLLGDDCRVTAPANPTPDPGNTGPFCVKCGADRSDIRPDVTALRKPCGTCGEIAVGYTRTFNVTTKLSVGFSSALSPARQDRNWRRRWDQLQRSLAAVTALHTEPRSADATHDAEQDLFDLFVAAYHLKDALIADGVVTGTALEALISHNAVLALLADLANFDKHRQLSKPPRSGVVPVIVYVSDESADDTWRLVVDIEHGADRYDGVAFAKTVIAEWRDVLTDERLV